MSWHGAVKNPEVPFALDQTITTGSVPQPSSRSKTAPLQWSNGVWKSRYEVLERLPEHCAEWEALTDTPEYLKCQSNALHTHKELLKTSQRRREQRLLRLTFVTLFFCFNTLWGLKNETETERYECAQGQRLNKSNMTTSNVFPPKDIDAFTQNMIFLT